MSRLWPNARYLLRINFREMVIHRTVLAGDFLPSARQMRASRCLVSNDLSHLMVDSDLIIDSRHFRKMSRD